jgi:hypothetical protein
VNTYLYFLYLRVYPFLQTYRVLLYVLYTLSLTYHLLHNLNRLAFQFEHLISMLDSSPEFFERVVNANLRQALARRV